MKPSLKPSQFCAMLLIASVLAGCSSSGYRAPVFERGDVARKKAAVAAEAARKKAARERDWRPAAHIVQKGDTLYSIAFNYGFDYHELAEFNGIKNPSVISLGQEIRLPTAAQAAEGPQRSDEPVASAVESKPIEVLIKEQPKVVKYPYSEAALAQIEKIQEPAKTDTPTVARADEAEADIVDDGEEAVPEWTMPAQGKLIARFSESANRKGIDIAGKLGQPIFAGATGKVVYSGSGLRGYGKLIIIKHNKTYLSAYAHNDKILVKEGQNVTRGQKIAVMGRTDTDQVKLHFEVRRLGKPVDPAKYLPLDKS